MNDAAQIIIAFATPLAVVLGFVVQWMQLRAQSKKIDNQTEKIESQAQKIDEVHAATNGLVEKAERAAEARGNLQGRKEEKAQKKRDADKN